MDNQSLQDQLTKKVRIEFESQVIALWQAAVEKFTESETATSLIAELQSVDPEMIAEMGRLWALSEYAGSYISQHPEFLVRLLTQTQWLDGWTEDQCRRALSESLSPCDDEECLSKCLRQFRHETMCKILWRDFNRKADMWETTASMTWMADACIDLALNWLYNDCCAKWGTPMAKDAQGEWVPQHMVVLGMGKLGAHELNVSSDIDLIFSFPENGETQGGKRTMENQTFFIRLGQRLVNVLDKTTADGFVFRTDMRLRPYGDSGALALSFSAMEEYYQDQGRDWERYAMIKARVVAGDKNAGRELMAALRPFVYRKYIDFSAFESLREMKQMIAREVRRKKLENNIKLGAGGIREIEFVVQAFQLIRGGRDKQLQCRELRQVLRVLEQEELLPAEVVDDLLSSYVFLRNLEHAIQGIKDKQTQLLPDNPIDQLRVAEIMGCESWEALVAEQQNWRDKVKRQFRAVVSVEEQQDDESAIDDHWHLIWEGKMKEQSASTYLADAGCEDVSSLLSQISSLRNSKPVVMMQVQGKQRLDKFMPLVLSHLTEVDNPGETLSRILNLVEAVLRRTAYLVLLYENPKALQQLVFLCSASPWIAEQLAQTPILLDELLNAESLYTPPNKQTLADELRQQLLRVPEDDLEEQMEVLRHFKKAHVLRVAASELRGTLPLMKVSDYLTFIAETVLHQVLQIAWQGLTAKHGFPLREVGVPCELDFAIIGYGKLGGIELGYTSDLDLVFVHDVNTALSTNGDRSVDNGVFFTRLGQRIIHILNTQTASGQLYEVDMRLRPSGNSGLLVSSLKAFKQYQENEAWTWEHQALVRSRAVAGDDEVAEKFESIRCEIIQTARDKDKLRQEVVDMRKKMRDSLGTPVVEGKAPEVFHTKHDAGGIVDIEFMVQYLALAYAAKFSQICRWSDNIRLLEECGKAGVIDEEKALALTEAFIALRSTIHRQALQNKSSKVAPDMFPEERKLIVGIWREIMES